MRDSRYWRAKIQNELGVDIDASPIRWVAIREWVAIRNHLVHQGRTITQKFLDSLADVAGGLTYSYTVGNDFDIKPGEIFRLLDSTRDFVDHLAASLP